MLLSQTKKINVCLHTLIVLFISLSFLPSETGFAQESDLKRKLYINYIFMNEIDIGGYEITGLSSRELRIPVSYTHYFGKVGSFSDRNRLWALKFMLDFNYGEYRFRGNSAEDMGARADVDAISLIPGIELRIPARDFWSVRPFIKGGFGWGNVTDESDGLDATSPTSYAYEGGLNNRLFWHLSTFRFEYGNTIGSGGFGSYEDDQDDVYAKLKNGIDIRAPLGVRIKSDEVNISVYFTHTRYFPDTEIPIISEEFEVEDQMEVGGSLGLGQRIRTSGDASLGKKIARLPLKLLNKRLVVGYRFGDGVKGVSIRFSIPLQ